MKKRILNILLCLFALPAWGATIYPMNSGNLRRENRSLAPSSITNPLKAKWISAACSNIDNPVGGPVVLNDRVIQCFTHGIRCVDRLNGNQVWLMPTDVELYTTPTYDPDRNVLYVCRMDGSTLCLSVDTGEVLWYFYEYNSSDIGMYCSPVYVNNTLIVGNGGQGLACLNPDTHQVIWRFNFSDYFGTSFRDAVATPAYDNGHIYFSSRMGHLFCLNASDGSVDWYVHEKSIRQNSLLLSDDYIFSMGHAGRVACLSRSDGSTVWTTKVTGTTDANLALCGTMLIVPGDSWRVWGLDMYTGKKRWCTKLTGNYLHNSPFVSCGKVYISACHGDYYGLDGQTGKVEWRYNHGVDLTFVDWAEADGNLFVACRDGRIFCFEPETPGNPTNCVCNLDGKWTPEPTPTRTPFPTDTPVTPGHSCKRVCSNPGYNQVYCKAENSVPPNDANGRVWTDPDYIPCPGWKTSAAVTDKPAEWVPACGSEPDASWIAPTTVGLPSAPATVYYRNDFTLPAGVTVSGVSFIFSCDMAVRIWLNGHVICDLSGTEGGAGCSYEKYTTITVDPTYFLEGNNALCFQLINDWAFEGLTYECRLDYSWPDWTPTPTPTENLTALTTPTVTCTFTLIPVSSPSFTATPTLTASFTPIPTETHIPTPSLTATPTVTETPTNTPMPTVTSAFTGTPVPSFTTTKTATSSSTQVHQCRHTCYPNPSSGEPIHFNLDGGPYDKVDICIYTTGMRKVCRKEHRCNGENETEVIWDLKDDYKKQVANGVYFAVIETQFRGISQKHTEKVLILR